MKLYRLQLTQFEVSKRLQLTQFEVSKPRGDGAVRVSRVGGPMHQVIAAVRFTERERAILATLGGMS